MAKHDELRENLLTLGERFSEVTGDYDFGNRVIHAFELYCNGICNDLRGMRGFDIGAGKGAALIAAIILGADFAVGIDRSFDEFGTDGYTKLTWRQLCLFYGVNPNKILFLKGIIPDTSFKEKSFDFVSFIDSIEHIPDPKIFINYGIEHLSDDGFLIIDTCPLFFSPCGHHLFGYFDTIKEPWVHLKEDFEQILVDKNVDTWFIERYHELNKCKYEDIKKIIGNHEGIFKIDKCPVYEEYIDLYELNKSLIDPSGNFGLELLCRNWVSIVWLKTKKPL